MRYEGSIKIRVSKEQRERGEKRYKEEMRERGGGRYNGRSYNGGKGLKDSMISEEVVSDYFGIRVIGEYDYDFKSESGKRIDLKTKSRSDSEPEDHWYCMVPSYQIEKQECDYYIFNRINRDASVVWILGYISKEEFKERSVYIEKGEILPDVEGSREWECWVSGYYMRISELNRFDINKLTDK
jgi:hypothetical protein